VGVRVPDGHFPINSGQFIQSHQTEAPEK
jgi:hypothetical protein